MDDLRVITKDGLLKEWSDDTEATKENKFYEQLNVKMILRLVEDKYLTAIKNAYTRAIYTKIFQNIIYKTELGIFK